MIEAEARVQASIDVLKRQSTRTIIPRFAETFIREVWEMQSRLLAPKPQHIMQLSSHARFRAGFDFLLLREQSGDASTEGMARWWEEFQELSTDQKEKAIADYRRTQQRSRKKISDTPEAFVPLILETEVNTRAARRAKQKNPAKALNDDRAVVAASERNHSAAGKDWQADHPILKRRRVQRDLSKVIFGPTQ